MIEQELILLGLLKESPKHGYQIKKDIKEILSIFAGIDLKSIYYPLRMLEKKRLVLKRRVKSGRRPARYVYELTEEGNARFETLLSKSFLELIRPKFSLDLSLYFLNYINPRIAKRRLLARIYMLHQLSRGLKQMIKSFEGRKPHSLVRILNHNLQMLEAESLFLSQLIKTL
ncbi:MAG: PadR family transcriptional regulator [Candidatus Omnitrophica bacterium]|nr:PadR family transcriptional regulator [Candidatus Omnitrophota bacterium]